MFLYFFIFLICFLPGCHNFKKNQNTFKQKVSVHRKFKKTYKLKIKNLHCKLCAYNLVKFISRIKGVINVKFNLVSKNYFESYFDVELDKRLAAIQDITVPLIKAGFIIDEKTT